MKRKLLSIVMLAAASTAAFAGVTKEDIKKLVAAGVGDDVIIAYVRANGGVGSLSADDVVELKGAGASDKVLSSVLGEKAPAKEQERAEQPVQAPSEAPLNALPVQRETVVVREPVYVERPVYVAPPYYTTPVYYRPAPYYYSNCYPRYSYAYYPRHSYSYSSYSCGPRYYSRPSFGVGYTRHSGRGAVSVGVRW